MGESGVLIFPSTWYEGLPRTIVESFAKGTPVIASRLGSMTELVEDGRTGYLFAPGDAAELADRVRRKWLCQSRRSLRDARQRQRAAITTRLYSRAKLRRADVGLRAGDRCRAAVPPAAQRRAESRAWRNGVTQRGVGVP